MHQGNIYELDNREFFRILLSLFNSTTLDNVVEAHQPRNDGMAAWIAILANVEGSNYMTELKLQGDKVIDGAFFDSTKNFTIEKYFDLHVESHVLHREAGAEVSEWRKIEKFMAGIRCTKLQNDYRNLKDDLRYSTFTTLYNKLNENYRTLINQKILKPVSIYKRKISQLGSDSNSPSRGGRGGRHGGRFGAGRRGGRGGRGYPRGRGRGRGGRGGRGNYNMGNINLKSLPSNIDLNDLSFPDDQWLNFTDEQKTAVTALRRLRNSGRQDNVTNDDMSCLENSTARGGNNNRHIYQLV